MHVYSLDDKKKKHLQAFTLIEVLLAVGLLSILGVSIIIAINPAKHFAVARDKQRHSDLTSLSHTLTQYVTDNQGNLFPGIDSQLRVIGSDITGCNIDCVTIVGSAGSTTNFTVTENSPSQFLLGTYSRTFFNTSTNAIELDASGLAARSGTYTSGVFDALDEILLETLKWKEYAPINKPLPDNGETETSYTQGNTSMSGNIYLAHLNSESGATISDTSGSNNGGTAYNTSSVTGKFAEARSFTGTSGSYIDVPNSSSLNPTNALTLEAWVKWTGNPATAESWAQILSKGGDNQYQLQHNQQNTQFEFAIRVSSARRYILSTTGFVVGNWYHVVGTFDGTTVRLYVNGILNTSATQVGTILTTNTNLNIGRRSQFNDRHFPGTIDEVAIYNRALSPAEISSHYQRGAARLNVQVRSCPDTTCTGITFVGPNGTSSTYYQNFGVNESLLQLQQLTKNRYGQYKLFYETDSGSVSPKLSSFTLSGSSGNLIHETAANECLNLESLVADDYTTFLPKDPKYGTTGNTYYAVRSLSNKTVQLFACKPEVEEFILHTLE